MTDNYILNGGQSNKTRNLNTNILNVDVLTQTPSMLDMYGYTFSDRDQVDTLNKLLNNEDNFIKMSKLHNPYGDGLASKRIVDFIKNRQ